MSLHWQDDWLSVYQGDCRAVMAELPAESVHCVVTSPPYWGLRDYGTASWLGGDEGCEHKKATPGTGGDPRYGPNKGQAGGAPTPMGQTCFRCGAVRQDAQLGLEPTPEEYVASMVEVFREVRRVLRSDGTVWLNLGDSYNAYNGGAGPSSALSQTASEQRPRLESGYGLRYKGLKPKDLVGIPWRVAFALQADGWYLRSDIIWSKPNPMPESVTDRPTKSHEYLFLLSKSPRYYYDQEAVRQPAARPDVGSFGGAKGRAHVTPPGDPNYRNGHEQAGRIHETAPMSNLRSVWTIATQPYPGAHFATFPRKLVEPCIKAGSPLGGVVLDPFAGSGTTALVAQSLGRRAILIDLSTDYLAQIMRRNAQLPLPA